MLPEYSDQDDASKWDPWHNVCGSTDCFDGGCKTKSEGLVSIPAAGHGGGDNSVEHGRCRLFLERHPPPQVPQGQVVPPPLASSHHHGQPVRQQLAAGARRPPGDLDPHLWPRWERRPRGTGTAVPVRLRAAAVVAGSGHDGVVRQLGWGAGLPMESRLVGDVAVPCRRGLLRKTRKDPQRGLQVDVGTALSVPAVSPPLEPVPNSRGKNLLRGSSSLLLWRIIPRRDRTISDFPAEEHGQVVAGVGLVADHTGGDRSPYDHDGRPERLQDTGPFPEEVPDTGRQHQSGQLQRRQLVENPNPFGSAACLPRGHRHHHQASLSKGTESPSPRP